MAEFIRSVNVSVYKIYSFQNSLFEFSYMNCEL